MSCAAPLGHVCAVCTGKQGWEESRDKRSRNQHPSHSPSQAETQAKTFQEGPDLGESAGDVFAKLGGCFISFRKHPSLMPSCIVLENSESLAMSDQMPFVEWNQSTVKTFRVTSWKAAVPVSRAHPSV